MPILENYIIEVDLDPDSFQECGLYPVTRTLSCPARMNFDELHNALKLAFDWTWRDDYRFEVHPHQQEVNCLTISCGAPLNRKLCWDSI